MSPERRFGGEWTEEKLRRIGKYLRAYTTIFTKNPRAATLTTIYVDAFAGTGTRRAPRSAGLPLLSRDEDPDAIALGKGSAAIALETDPPFDRYLFIEREKARIRDLEVLRGRFPTLASRVAIERAEANDYLRRWCTATEWRTHRAVVFLDPYGMEVEWSTIETIAATEAIDLWLLFPLGQAVNRLLTRRQPPAGAWSDRLTAIFGTPDWKEEFYRASPQGRLFTAEPEMKKEADFDRIGRFFVGRLQTVFAGVAEHPLALRNSKNVPIFLLCFAAGNPKGARTAVRIAGDILRG